MRVAVLVSGSGSNLQSLLDAAASDPGFGADIALVVSDRPHVRALDRAVEAGVASRVVTWAGERSAFTTAVCDTVEEHGCEAMVLAGFMRILGPEAVARFPNRILNIHPSLLPAFPGAHAVPQALAHGVKLSGVTVHFVDEEVDHGPVIAQRPVPVHPDDDEERLHGRIQEHEHVLYPAVVSAFARGLLQVNGRIVTWEDE